MKYMNIFDEWTQKRQRKQNLELAKNLNVHFSYLSPSIIENVTFLHEQIFQKEKDHRNIMKTLFQIRQELIFANTFSWETIGEYGILRNACTSCNRFISPENKISIEHILPIASTSFLLIRNGYSITPNGNIISHIQLKQILRKIIPTCNF